MTQIDRFIPIKTPKPEEVLVAVISQFDKSICVMGLSDFVRLIAADKETVAQLEAIVARKVDESALEAAGAAIDKRLAEITAEMGDIDVGSKEGLAKLALTVQAQSGNIAELKENLTAAQADISKNKQDISGLVNNISALAKRVEKLEAGQNGARPAQNKAKE